MKLLIEIVGTLMFLDLVSGLLKGLIKGELNSKKDIMRKGFYILYMVLAFSVDRLLGEPVFVNVISFYIIGLEGISILENAYECGVPFPQVLKDRFEQMKGE